VELKPGPNKTLDFTHVIATRLPFHHTIASAIHMSRPRFPCYLAYSVCTGGQYITIHGECPIFLFTPIVCDDLD
jgi:hypothetical protein